MRWLLIALWLLLPVAAQAQVGQVAQFAYHPSGGASCTGGYQGQGDVLSGASFYYGLRGYTCTYAGPGNNPAIDIRRASDSTTTTINILASGFLDTTTATIFCAATTCFVSKWYDQSGNGLHAIQATTANQPQLSFTCSGISTACLTFSGSQWLAGGTSTIAPNWIISMVVEWSTFGKWFFGAGSGGAAFGDYNAVNVFSYLMNTAGLDTFAAASNAFHSIQPGYSTSFGQGIVNIDGSQNGTSIPINLGITSPWTVGSLTGSESANAFTGEMEEIGAWPVGTTTTIFGNLCHNQFVSVGTPTSC
jgi:hypothetical protein